MTCEKQYERPYKTKIGESMNKAGERNKIGGWLSRNAAALALVLAFIAIHIVSHNIASYNTEDIFSSFGAVGIPYLNGEYYRWFACLFLHYDLGHLTANCAALLSVSSLLSSFLSK